jgi:pimeloyl-ACP methyl ester carboxylesterase
VPTLTTDQLEIAYADAGPCDGQPVLLLHGWPDSPPGTVADLVLDHLRVG